MSDPIPQDRSPRSPSLPLADSITLTAKLFDGIRTATVAPEIAVKPLGYGSTNGAAMSTLATLAQYGLVDRTGGKVTVTSLAIRILHPKSESQKEESIREAALAPKIMRELYDGYLECSEDVIRGHLIQSGFNTDRAKRLAAIHSENRVFAKLAPPESILEEDADTDVTDDEKNNRLTPLASALSSSRHSDQPAQTVFPQVSRPAQTVLAQYSIPLGANQAQLIFTGTELLPEDFDALRDYVDLFKKQFERSRIKTESPSEKVTKALGELEGAE